MIDVLFCSFVNFKFQPYLKLINVLVSLDVVSRVRISALTLVDKTNTETVNARKCRTCILF